MGIATIFSNMKSVGQNKVITIFSNIKFIVKFMVFATIFSNEYYRDVSIYKG